MIRTTAIALLSLFTVCTANAEPFDLDVSTDFEFVGTRFTIGDSPLTARFTNGRAATTDTPHSGTSTWQVEPDLTGLVEFETDVEIVEFYARSDDVLVGASISVWSNTAVLRIVDVTSEYQLFSFRSDVLGAKIDHMTFENPISGSQGLVLVDDLGFSLVVPEPASASLILFGMTTLLAGLIRKS